MTYDVGASALHAENMFAATRAFGLGKESGLMGSAVGEEKTRSFDRVQAQISQT
jgi:hypothetical protein